MNANSELVKKLFDACNQKDFETARGLLHDDYSLKDPLMELHSADEMIEMMKNCPGGGMAENLTMIAEDDKVVTLFDGTMQDKTQKMRMCSVVTVEGGKVKSEEMFYDTAKMPQEMKDMMQKGKSPEDAALAAH
ncbi:MAG: nuclear transport factor 2 family protein [Alphaproteobacteria bacterium]